MHAFAYMGGALSRRTRLHSLQKRPHGGDGSFSQDKRPKTEWSTEVVDNGLFQEYYQGQGVCPPEVRGRHRHPPPPPVGLPAAREN